MIVCDVHSYVIPEMDTANTAIDKTEIRSKFGYAEVHHHLGKHRNVHGTARANITMH